MGIFRKLTSFLSGLSSSLSADLAMDLGTANTLIHRRGEGIIINEPSAVAIDVRTGRAVAIGREAREFIGRTPPHIVALRPLKDGVIADFDAAMAMIRGFLSRAIHQRFWMHPRIVIGVPSGITKVEKRAVKDAALQAGAAHVFLIEEPMAAAMGSRLEVEMPKGNMVVDIGGGTTEVAIISLGTTAYCESIKVAGDEMDEAIVQFLQKNLHVEVTPTLAEDIKLRIGCAVPITPEKTMQITGRQVGRGGPLTLEVSSTQMSEALEEPVDAILDAIRAALEHAPAAFLGDIKDRGMLLSGGGSLLPELDTLITKMTGIHAYVAEDPLAAVVLGCGLAVHDLGRWSRTFIG